MYGCYVTVPDLNAGAKRLLACARTEYRCKTAITAAPLAPFGIDNGGLIGLWTRSQFTLMMAKIANMGCEVGETKGRLLMMDRSVTRSQIKCTNGKEKINQPLPDPNKGDGGVAKL
ncbi:hypothetical protein MTP99_010052 [Tenebrio molitor]|jgi:hypothetical protein|nr:hypothetical protein MTP99_010052 [Tenebrio molitor]